MSEVRSKANCAFYPACYVMGDCAYDGWKTGTCGLSDEAKAAERQKFREQLDRTLMRQRLITRVNSGEFDHLDIAQEQPHDS